MEEENKTETSMETSTETTTSESPKKGPSSVVVVIVSIIALALLLGGMWVAQQRSKDTSMMQDETMEESMEQTDTMEDGSMLQDESMMEGDASDSGAMTEDESMMDENVKVVQVEGGSFYFDPDTITVKKGQAVKIVLNSVDTMHNFVIDEFDVKTEIVQSGNTAEVTFTPDQVGEFEYYCSVGNHRALGMVGTLVVTE